MTYQLKMNALLGIDEDIETRLKNRQKGKEFKDTGVAKYTRKYRAAYDIITSSDLSEIEKDSVQAYRLIDKSKIWPLYKPSELKAEGNTSGAAYIKVKAREALSAKPLDTPEAREIYVRSIEKLIALLKPLKTLREVMKALEKFADIGSFDFSPAELANSYKARQYFMDIFSKRFYNFCHNNSESVRKTVSEAFLYDGYTAEQRTAEIDSRADYNKHLSREQLEKSLSKYYTIRDEDWSWGNIKDKTVKVVDQEGKPRDPQNIFEKYGIATPKNLKRAFLKYVKRKGGLAIDDLSTTAIVKKFGFHRVVYGNYVNDSESKTHTYHILGALLDLTEVCNINMIDVNELGGLDLNIGATGCGAFSKAIACYFPSLKAINITKNRGDGSLAHEWGHYLDNALAEGTTKRATNVQYATTSSSGGIKSERVAKLMTEYQNWLLTGGTKREVTVTFYPQSKFKFNLYGTTLESAIAGVQSRHPSYRQYDNISHNMANYYGYLAKKFNDGNPIEVTLETTSTEYYYNSSRFGNNDYLLNPKELFARAFETWVEYKLEKMNRYNNYLVDISKGLGMFAAIIPRDKWFYPAGSELLWLDDWFTRLFSAIRTDYGIKPFDWNTKERVDEYTEYIDKGEKVPKTQEPHINVLLLKIRIAKAKLKLLKL